MQDTKTINNKIAIIHNDRNSYFARLIQKRGFRVESAYKKTNLVLRILRKIHFKYNLPFKTIWYQKNMNLKSFDTILIFDAAIKSDFVHMIRLLFPNKRIILWYWNPVRNSIDPQLLSGEICEKWSYSINDCKKYALSYNDTFFFKELVFDDSQKTNFINYDIFFIGRDKGRLNLLLEYKKKFNDLGLKTYFHITPTKGYMLKSHPIYRKNIPYNKILELIKESKVILDIVQNQNDGLTLRAMESIFFNKKLVTNSEIIKKYDFYCRDNIFILGEDDIYDLPEFINSPYKKIDSEIIVKYDFVNWINRFIEEV